jgi:hypothetical protein
MGSFSAFEETGSIATGLGAYINTTAAILGSGGLELVAQTFFISCYWHPSRMMVVQP